MNALKNKKNRAMKVIKKVISLEKRMDELSTELRNVLMLQLQKETDKSSGNATYAVQQNTVDRKFPIEAQQAALNVPEDIKQLEDRPEGLMLRYPELFYLYRQGKSIEQIAKKLGINKGETALIIQLAKQEEEGRA